MKIDKFQNKYRISSTRLQNWDYGCNASYFITICIKNRKHFFGEILDGEMRLSNIGEYANQFWNEITNHFPFVILDAFVVMPNHIHGIVIIDKPYDGKKSSKGATDGAVDGATDGATDGRVETLHATSLRPPIQPSIRPPIWTPTIPIIIRISDTTTKINKWQTFRLNPVHCPQ